MTEKKTIIIMSRLMFNSFTKQQNQCNCFRFISVLVLVSKNVGSVKSFLEKNLFCEEKILLYGNFFRIAMFN